jgi:hypothetical protein
MKFETVRYGILDDTERSRVRFCIGRCNPEGTSPKFAKIRKSILNERKFSVSRVKLFVLPYLDWLYTHYLEVIENADKEIARLSPLGDLVESFITDFEMAKRVSQERLPLVADVREIFVQILNLPADEIPE